MTRKDYVAIAAAIKALLQERPAAPPQRVAQVLADHMARENPRFDRARFLKACGVQS
jgi:hypothetical protein